jgi:hypothetical protein
MIIGHPGTWQQFQFRPDNRGLNVMEMKSKYLHEQYLFEAELFNLQQQHQQNVFMNGGGGGSTSSPSGPILEAGSKIIFTANSISDVNDDLGWNVESIEGWKTNAFNTTSGEITYLTVNVSGFGSVDVIVGGLFGLEVEVRDDAFTNKALISSMGSTDIVGVEQIIIGVGLNSFRNSTLIFFQSDKCQQVGPNAFKDCLSLVAVNLSNGSENLRLENGVFNGCTSLDTINLGFNEINITGNGVFEGCVSIPNISQFGGRITNMSGVNIFKGCTNLSSVIIGLESGTFTGVIGDNCFEGCTNLNSFTLYNAEGNPGDQSIGSYVFLSCENLSSITIFNLLTLSGTGIFAGVNPFGNASFKTDQNIITYDPNNNISYLTDVPTRSWVITYT